MSARKLPQKILVVLAALACVASGCSKDTKNENDPKQRLTDYVHTSFSIHDTTERTKLESYLTGGAKNRLVAWSDDQFREAFVDSKRKDPKLAIREVKPVTANRTDITYELSYVDEAKGAGTRVTTKRMCEMTLEDGKWLIRDVKNIKELIEYKNEMSIVY
jgi:hypothetical protein